MTSPTPETALGRISPAVGLPRPEAERRPLRRAAPSPAFAPFCFAMLLVWIVFEYARPSNPMKVPLIASITLVAGWLAHPRKQWPVQVVCLLLFVAQMGLSVPIATNTYSAYMMFEGMVITVATIAIPLVTFVDTIPRAEQLVKVLAGVLFYMGIWGVTHGGIGPAGAWGAQDENYTSAYMCVAIPISFFGLFHFRSLPWRAFFVTSLLASIGSIVVSFSRGGFVGLCAVGLFCWWRTPRKWIGAMVVIVALAALPFFAGEGYWTEMGTITDTKESTADARIDAWKIAWRMYLGNPILGVGSGNFPWRMGDYQGADLLAKHGRIMTANMVTHSLYFELIAELGSVGLGIFLVACVSSLRGYRWTEREARSVRESLKRIGRGRIDPDIDRSLHRLEWIGQSLQASLIGFLVCSLFISSLYMSTFWILASIAAATQGTARHFFESLALRDPGSIQHSRPLAAGPSTPPPDPHTPQALPARPGRFSDLLGN